MLVLKSKDTEVDEDLLVELLILADQNRSRNSRSKPLKSASK